MNLKELRKVAGLTAATVAKKLEIAVSTLYNYEQGVRTIDIYYIIPLAELYGVNVEDIIKAQLNSIAIRQAD